MNASTVRAQIKSLETQLGVLKAQLDASDDSSIQPLHFSQLFGILADGTETSEDEIHKARYKIKFESDLES